jgi:cold shock CspA family protein
MSSERLIGRVKWFNSKSGFGFITVCDGAHKDNDIFTHFTSLRGDSTQYKYMVQGEYVEFVLSTSENEQHEFIATDVSGINGGLMMCDTHRLNATTRTPVPVSDSRQFSDTKRRPRPIGIAKKAY